MGWGPFVTKLNHKNHMIAKKALIVDDSKTACAVLARMLKPYGIDSDSVYSAEDALEYLQSGNKPDVIFMDHSMPGMDGLETVKIIKDDPNTAMIPVMMYTARSGEVYMGQARALGAIDVLPKELKPTLVEQALNKLGVIKSSGHIAQHKEQEQIQVPKHEALVTPSKVVLPKVTQTTAVDTRMGEHIEAYVHEELHKLKEDLAYSLSASLSDLQNDYIRHTRRLLKQQTGQFDEKVEEKNKVLLRDFHQYSDFKEAQTARENRKRVFAIVAVLVTTLGLVGWLFKDGNKFAGKLDVLEGQGVASISLLEHMEGRFQRLEGTMEKLRNDVSASGNNGPISPHLKRGVNEVRDSSGLSMGKLVGYSQDGRLANILTETEYLMQLDVKGQLATKLPVRYFLGAGCYGDSYVEAHDGVIFLSGDRSIWFTELKSDIYELMPQYQTDAKNGCKPYEGEGRISLRALHPNEPEITRVDRIQYDFFR